MVQIIVLAAVAFFLFWRLRSVLGSRQGFERLNKDVNEKDDSECDNDIKIIDIKNTEEFKKNLDKVNITNQGEFLTNMGIFKRAEMISKSLSFSKKSDLYYRLQRLVDDRQMGKLFKVMFATKKKNKFSMGFK